jgi:PAS domain S-box-containing protein
VRVIEEDNFADQSLHTLASQAPSEVAPLLYGLHVTHARLRRTLRQLEQDRAEVEAIFEHMADSVLVVDAYERIVLSNPAARRMLRYPSPLGRGLAEVTRDADLVSFARDVSAESPEARVIELFVADGERRWVQAVATRLPEKRRLLVLQDISELRRAEVARRDFVANVSHELRTPVAALTTPSKARNSCTACTLRSTALPNWWRSCSISHGRKPGGWSCAWRPVAPMTW